jgi:hypothetical protein
LSNLDASFKENYSIDELYFDDYVEEEDSFYCPVILSLTWPKNYIDGSFIITISANAYFDYSYNFLGVNFFDLTGNVYMEADGTDYEMFNINRPYNNNLGSYMLDFYTNGHYFQYHLVVDGDVEILFDESLPQFVLDNGDFPNTLVLSDYFNEVSYYLNELNVEVEDKSFFGVLSDTIVNYIKSLTDNFKNLTALFYADNKLTFLGILTLIGFGIGITKWGINLVVDLLRL